MDFQAFEPNNSLLNKHIAYYYFQKSYQKGDRVIYYPHYNTAINFYKNCEVNWNDKGRIITASSNENTQAYLTINPRFSRTVSLIGEIDKIGIVFKPLGINHFIVENLNRISNDVLIPFNVFGDVFSQLAQTIYLENRESQKVAMLDDFFFKKYVGFEDVSFVKEIVNIVKKNSDFKVEELAKILGINRKSVLRTFKRHLCCTPREFKAVVRFRNAIHQYQNEELKSKLTTLAYDSLYYDQSDFIKHCKSFVGLSPKVLFQNLNKVGLKETYWTKI